MESAFVLSVTFCYLNAHSFFGTLEILRAESAMFLMAERGLSVS